MTYKRIQRIGYWVDWNAADWVAGEPERTSRGTIVGKEIV